MQISQNGNDYVDRCQNNHKFFLCTHKHPLLSRPEQGTAAALLAAWINILYCHGAALRFKIGIFSWVRFPKILENALWNFSRLKRQKRPVAFLSIIKPPNCVILFYIRLAVYTNSGTVQKEPTFLSALSFITFNYIMPIPPPAGIAGASSLMEETTDSVVSNVEATLVAFCSALLLTFAGSRIPASIMSTYFSS